MQLLIGDKAWSTWSMRPWLVLSRAGCSFEEVVVRLRQDDTAARIREAGSPSSKVPALIDGGLVVWDSLAICEYLADLMPEANLWPRDRAARALARAATAEMHSGFAALRQECPMDLKLHTKLAISDATQNDVRRIVALWRDLRGRQADEGPFLLGGWSIADAFFTPVATRFRTYGVDLAQYGDDGAAADYNEALLSTPEFLDWERGALAE